MLCCLRLYLFLLLCPSTNYFLQLLLIPRKPTAVVPIRGRSRSHNSCSMWLLHTHISSSRPHQVLRGWYCTAPREAKTLLLFLVCFCRHLRKFASSTSFVSPVFLFRNQAAYSKSSYRTTPHTALLSEDERFVLKRERCCWRTKIVHAAPSSAGLTRELCQALSTNG